MDRLNLFVGDVHAGTLSREGRRHTVRYAPGYEGPPVFLGWKSEDRERSWDEFPPAFDGLLPEGALLDQLLSRQTGKVDKWDQLIAVGRDLPGFLSVIPEGSKEVPCGKLVSSKLVSKRASVVPGQDALPFQEADLFSFYNIRELQMSISGPRPKVAAVYARAQKIFRPVPDSGGYILKLSTEALQGAVENEILTMELARHAGIEVPLCGWLPTKDGHGVFWIERFDRRGSGNRQRLRSEDACQLIGKSPAWKQHGIIEIVADLISRYCSNPKLQLLRFYQRVLFCWITGNGNMHLKKWSLVGNGPLIELSPAYGLLNTRLRRHDEQESALALDGQTSGFDRKLLVDYLGREVCQLNDRMIDKTLKSLADVNWYPLIERSRLGLEASRRYHDIVHERLGRLQCA